MSHPTRQHYVPRLLLREFADPTTGLVSVYDKHEDRCFQAKPTRIAVENEFYDLKISDSLTISAEEGLSTMEGSVSEVLNTIRAEESLAGIGVEGKARLSLFIAVQTYRVPHMRESLLNASNQLEESFERIGINPDQIANWQSMETEDAKRLTMKMMSESAETLAPHIFDKLWLLQRTSVDRPFYISDNPVALHNDRDLGPFGNIGFAVEGIQIHFPISRTLSLLMMCPSHGERVRSAHSRLWRILKENPGSSVAFWDTVVRITKIDNALNYGSPFDLSPTHVRHHNSLQVKYGNRWIYCPSSEFALVKEMIKDSEAFRTGPLMQVGMPASSEGDFQSPQGS